MMFMVIFTMMLMLFTFLFGPNRVHLLLAESKSSEEEQHGVLRLRLGEQLARVTQLAPSSPGGVG